MDLLRIEAGSAVHSLGEIRELHRSVARLERSVVPLRPICCAFARSGYVHVRAAPQSVGSARQIEASNARATS